MKKGLSVLLAGVMAISLYGCSSNESKEQVKLTIAAAASLENAFEDELIPMFEKEYPNVTIEGVYDSSGKLQLQIEKGLDADVFFSAATTQMNTLKDEDLVDADSISNVLENKLVLIKGKDSTTTVTGFDNIRCFNYCDWYSRSSSCRKLRKGSFDKFRCMGFNSRSFKLSGKCNGSIVSS